MSGIYSIALSGMQAAQTQFAIGANNIANSNTPGFKASRADLVELSGGGVGVGGVTVDPTPGAIGSEGKQASNVDLASAIVGIAQDKTLYDANAMVLRTADRMMGSLLDMFDTDQRRDR